MAQLVTYFPHKHKDLSLDPKHPLKKPGISIPCLNYHWQDRNSRTHLTQLA